MDSRKLELLQDLQEFKTLLASSERSSVRTLLLNEIKSLETELSTLISPDSPAALTYKSLDKWAWDQDEKHVRVYITSLPNLKQHAKEKVILESTASSATVSIHDVDGVNYKVKFPKLAKEISSCRISLKSNGFSLTMVKATEGNWENLEHKVSIFDKKEEEEKKDLNVQEKFFDMMNTIYKEGDEKMKESIGVPWMKAMADVYRPITK